MTTLTNIYIQYKSLISEFNSSRQGVKDVAVSSMPQLIGVVTGLIGSILLARGLGPAELGNYSLVISLVGISGIISDFGIAQTAIRYASYAAARNDTTWQMMILRWALRVRLTIVFIASIFLCVIGPVIATRYWHNASLIPYIYIGLIGGIFRPLSTIPSIYFQSIRRFTVNAFINSSQRIFAFAGILIIAILSSWKLLYVILSNALAGILGALLFLTIVPKDAIISHRRHASGALSLKKYLLCPQSPSGNVTNIENPTNFAVLQMLLTIILNVTSQADIWLMGYFLDKSQIGVYIVAMRFTLPFSIVIAAINTALWPRASALHSTHSTIQLLKKTMKVCLVIFALGLFYALLAPRLTRPLFGDAYSSGITIAQLLCLKSCIALLYYPISLIGYSFGMIRHYLMIAVLNFFLIVVIDIMFLPKFGIAAAALALLLSEVVQLFVGGGIIFHKYRDLKVADV
jgi:O-antigen/teichoic acid export membrane protein